MGDWTWAADHLVHKSIVIYEAAEAKKISCQQVKHILIAEDGVPTGFS